MSERWKNYMIRGLEAAGGPIPFAIERWNFEQPVFREIRRLVPADGRVLEVGCGAGILTALLSHYGYRVVGVDNDPEIVNYAREMAAYFRSNATIERASAEDLSAYHGRFDLAFSLGVVEHFDADVSVDLMREQARCAPLIVAAIPTRYTKYTPEGLTDARIYTRRQFERLVRKAGLKVRKSFVYGEVPTRFRLVLYKCLPVLAYRGLQRAFTYAMSICCVGEKARALGQQRPLPAELKMVMRSLTALRAGRS